jgi:hypothetical protein
VGGSADVVAEPLEAAGEIGRLRGAERLAAIALLLKNERTFIHIFKLK